MPDGVAQETLGSRYGLTVIEREGDRLRQNRRFASELLSRNNEVAKFLGERQSERVFEVNASRRSQTGIACRRLSEDLAGYVAGDALDLQLRSTAQSGAPFLLRDYQKEAAAVFYQAGRVRAAAV